MFESYKPRDYAKNFFKHNPNRDKQEDAEGKRGGARGPSKCKRINAVSDKRQKEGKIYAKLRRQFLAEHPKCEIKWDDKCSDTATQVHHVKFRGRHYLDILWWKSGCAHCHRMVTDNGREAERRGHIVREYKSPS